MLELDSVQDRVGDHGCDDVSRPDEQTAEDPAAHQRVDRPDPEARARQVVDRREQQRGQWPADVRLDRSAEQELFAEAAGETEPPGPRGADAASTRDSSAASRAPRSLWRSHTREIQTPARPIAIPAPTLTAKRLEFRAWCAPGELTIEEKTPQHGGTDQGAVEQPGQADRKPRTRQEVGARRALGPGGSDPFRHTGPPGSPWGRIPLPCSMADR